tara:strand:- start:1099 stop:1476 length:378 start_codon:yes stop_codon:yes gene_type:complete
MNIPHNVRAAVLLADQEAYAIVLDRERVTNGGLTNYEAEQANRMAKQHHVAMILGPITRVLVKGNSLVCFELHRALAWGQVITPSQQTIIVEIMTKQYGRVNSKEYNDRYPEVEAMVAEILEVLS